MTKARDIADLGSNDVLDTSSSGIDVTGSVTADGLTVSTGATGGIASFSGANGNLAIQNTSTNNVALTLGGSDNLNINTQTGAAFRLTSDGDISFYDSAGSNAKFFWDAADESLGIGLTYGDASLNVYKSSALYYDSSYGSTRKTILSAARSAGTGIGVKFTFIPNSGNGTTGKIHINVYNGNSGVGSTSQIIQEFSMSQNTSNGIVYTLGNTYYTGYTVFQSSEPTVSTGTNTLTITFPSGTSAGNDQWAVEVDQVMYNNRDITVTLV